MILPVRRPRLALPFTVLRRAGTVRLVAGEDFRYTLEGRGIEDWAPPLLEALRGRHAVDTLLGSLAPSYRPAAAALIERLYAERVLVDGTAEEAHEAAPYRLDVEGEGEVATLLQAGAGVGRPLRVLCQDRLDFAAALSFGRARRAAGEPWLWVSTGAMTRGLVGPVFLPDAGPCIGCLLAAFERRSPLPELYGELIAHAQAGRAMAGLPFPALAARLVAALVEWKVSRLALALPPPATFRLHVVEASTMEISTHRTLIDPHCGECGRA